MSAPLSAQVRTGPGAEALPAVGQVAVAEPVAGVVSGSVDVGYQWIEPLADESGSHHGGTAVVGVAVPLGQWVLVGASVHGAGMVHPRDAMGADRSGTGFPALAVRVMDVRAPLAYGVEVTGLFPGQDAPSIDIGATSLRASALVTYAAPNSAWVYAVNAGYFLDNSANAAPPIASLRQGDRTALGASSFDAVSLGAAAAYQAEAWLFFGDVSSDVLYSAPRPSTSPLRVGLGARYALSRVAQLEARAQLGLSARPGFDAEHYQAFEPRFAVFVGPRFTWGGESEAAPAPPPVTSTPPRVVPVATPEIRVVHDLVGSVTDAAGAPLAQVTLSVTSGDFQQQVESATDGSFRFTAVPVGDLDVRASTVDYEPAAVGVHVDEDAVEVRIPPIQLEIQAARGAQVEGVIRAFDGTVPPATVTLEPGSRTCSTDADGRFALDVGPGMYRVTVSAPGYESQTRSVTVQKQGVVIVNVDLRAK